MNKTIFGVVAKQAAISDNDLMELQTHRDQTRQLADDFGWLEDHCRKSAELNAHTAQLRLAGALTRNVIGPAVDGQGAIPLHLAVVGGAGVGKSTVANWLIGSVVAAANPQAGFTRHPTAFVPASLAASWPSSHGFLGPLQRLSEDQPASFDQDVYQVRLGGAGGPTASGSGRHEAGSQPSLGEFVIWDCPDMTTWASEHYVDRLMEVVALADVVVYVASDERYNDEVPTQFLHLLVKAGKAVVCCLTKMRVADAAALVDHFRKEVLGRLPQPDRQPVEAISSIPITAIPYLPVDVRNDPAGDAAAVYRVPLLNQILSLCPDPETTRRRTLTQAVRYLESAGAGLLSVARRDLTEFDDWRGLVNEGRVGFEERYRREYLAGETFRRFDKTREQVMAMLELPGPGRMIAAWLALLRAPYRYLREFAGRTLIRPPVPNLTEQTVCLSSMTAWLDSLQAGAIRRATGDAYAGSTSATTAHQLWKQIIHGFDAGLKSRAKDLFQQHFRQFEMKEADDLDCAARALPERLTNSPLLLSGLRIAAVALDFLMIILILVMTWVPSWYHLLFIPLAVSLSRQLYEAGVMLVVDAGRNRLRERREKMVAEHLSGPITAWLTDWPSASGTSLERLNTVLRRIPELIRLVADVVQAKFPVSTPPSITAPQGSNSFESVGGGVEPGDESRSTPDGEREAGSGSTTPGGPQP